MLELRGYLDENGNKRFAAWLEGLDAVAAAKVTIALARMEQGNFSKVKGVGSGVFEYKIDFWSRLPHLFRQGWRPSCDSHWRRH